MTDRLHTVSIASDNRARIPFALIAVLLLISSIAIVGVLESRERPDIDTERAVAMDRAESVAVGELRRAVLRATDEAASAPVTSTDGADATVSDAFSDDEAVFDQYLKLLIYREVSTSFATVPQQLGQDTAADVSVERIDWDDSDDIEAAIDRVSLEKDEPGVLTVEFEDVELTANESDGEAITEQRDLSVTVGTPLYQLKERTEEFQHQLNTGFFESDGRYDGLGRYAAARLFPYAWGKAYYDRLSSGQRAFDNLTPNDHTEVMVNDAIFGLQEKTFGTTDPYKDRAMLQPTLCMAGDLASSAGDIQTEDFLPDGRASNLSNETDLCSADLLDQDGELPDPPTVQDIVLTMLEDNVETDVEIQAHPFADLAYMEMAAGMNTERIEAGFNDSLEATDRFNSQYLSRYYSDSLENQDLGNDIGSLGSEDEGGTIDKINELFKKSAPNEDSIRNVVKNVYDMNVRTVENGPFKYDKLPEPKPPEDWAQNPENWSGPVNVTRYGSISRADADVSITIVSEGDDTDFDDRDFAEIDVRYTNSIGVSAEWEHEDQNRSPHTYWNWKDDVTYGASYTITGDLVSDAIEVERERRGIESPFSTDSWNESYSSVQNFEGVKARAVKETFGLSSSSVTAQERELERTIERSSASIVTGTDFREAIPYSADPTVDVSPRDEAELYEWALAELNRTHYQVVTNVDPHRADLWQMVEKPSPLGNIERNVSKRERKLVYQNASAPYDNTADLLRAEVRKQYFENIYDNIDEVSGWHDETLGESSAIVNDLLGGTLDSGNDLLGGPLDFVDRMMDPETRPEETRGELEGSPLLEDVNYQIEASPTYLSLETVNRTEVPAVRPEGGETLAIDDIDDVEHAPMGAGYIDGVGHPGFPLLPWPSLFYLQLDAYYLEVQGEYARFEVRTDNGDSTSSSGTTYVRQDTNVAIETPSWSDRTELAVGSTEPIAFDNDLVIPIVTPSPQLLAKGTPGVGDPWRYNSSNSPRKDCSKGWNEVGAAFENTSDCLSSGGLPV